MVIKHVAGVEAEEEREEREEREEGSNGEASHQRSLHSGKETNSEVVHRRIPV